MARSRLLPAAAAAALAAVALTAAPAAAGILYHQPSNFPDGFTSASQNDTAPGGFGSFATVYDNFTLGSAASVTGVAWTGSYYDPLELGPISGFTLTFYADAAGQPGAALLTQTLPGTAGETFVGIDASAGNPVYDYSAALPTAFAAAAGTPYWLSIVADLDFPPVWGWHSGSGGDGVQYQDYFGDRYQDPLDSAFTLSGTAVPEPASVALLGTGVVGLLGYARRRKATA